MIEVWLEPYEMEMCERAGRDRFASARALQRNPGLGWASKGKVQGDIRGAQCEFAASIGLNLSWRPTVGKVDRIDVGDMVEFGGLLGSAPIMPVSTFSAAAFIRRGGRIPAPIHSLRN